MNVIYILDDDHRAELLGCAGHPILKTPHLDKLAKQGIRFKNAFCTSPICTPSRTCHYLGQWERKHGVNFNSHSSVAPEAWEKSFPQQLKKAGYFTGWVGKNHVPVGQNGYTSGYMENIFDYWYGNHNHSGFYPKTQAPGGKIYGQAQQDTQVEIFEEGAMNFLDPQEAFLQNAKKPLPKRPKDQPFCLCLTFNLPHAYSTGNMQLRPEDDPLYHLTYRDQFDQIALPKTYAQVGTPSPPRIPLDVYNNVRIPSYDYVHTPLVLRERRIREFQAITGIDRAIGHLREKLDELNLTENTLIIFSTDHGIHHGEHGLGGKCFLYEEDLRIPMIVYDPRLEKADQGQVRDEMVLVPDLAPTVLDLCDQPIPDTMQGCSLAPLLNNQSTDWRQDFFAEQLMDIQNYPRSEAVRSHDWKYIRYFKRTEDPAQTHLYYKGTLDHYDDCLTSTLKNEQPIYEELFDLTNDPLETQNLATDPSQQDRLQALRQRIMTLGQQAKEDDRPPLTLTLPA